jgi:hypothetical protein
MTPEVCTLPGAELPVRLAEFDALFAVARVVERPTRTRLRVVLDAPAAAVSDLAARETQCCSFFDFEVGAVDGGTELIVNVPDAYAAVLDGMAAR